MSLCGKNGMAQLEGKLLIIFAGILPCGTLYTAVLRGHLTINWIRVTRLRYLICIFKLGPKVPAI